MKIETQILEDHRAKLTVEVENDLLESTKRRAAAKIARKVRIPGFRPGKAPYQVIVRHVGEASLLEEALELLVDDIYPKVIEEANIKPYGPGKLENVLSMEPLKLEFVVSMEAEVDLGDYRSIRKPYQPSEINDQNVEAALQELRERQAIIELAEHPAQEGDLVTIRLSAKRTNAEEGQEPVLIRESSFPIVVRPAHAKTGEDIVDGAQTNEWPFAGFSRHLIGLTENEERTVHHKYPEDADSETLREVEADFSFKIVSVKSRKLPDLDDEFAASIGEYADLEALRKSIRSALENQSKENYTNSYDSEILKEGINQASFKYPSQMHEREIDRVVDEFRDRLENQGLDLDLYLKTRNLNMESLREEMKPIAEERLKQRLFLAELSNAEDITIEEEELRGETQNTMEHLFRILPEKEARKLSQEDVYRNLVVNVLADMLSHRAVERFRDICSGKIEQEQIADKDSQINLDSDTEVRDSSEIHADHSAQLVEETIIVNDVVNDAVKDNEVVNDDASDSEPQ